MEVREIDTVAAFDALRGEWEAAFAADPQATPFVSWSWLRGWIDVTPHPWTVLAARDRAGEPWIGFLPLSVRGSRSALRVDHLREVHMAGEPTADYAGFVCGAAHQDRVIAVLARYVIEHLPWDRLRFEEVRDPRMSAFMAQMPDSFNVREHEGTPCPRIALPATWAEFMQSLSYSTRQSLRKRVRDAESEFHITRLDRVNDEAMIDALIKMAINRTRESPDPHTWRLHSMLRRCALADAAHVLLLWKDQTPVAGVGSLIDRKEGSFGLYVTAFDEQFASFSPGRVAVALTIRDAIDMGMLVFDFLRGEEPYKFQFGGVSRHNRTLTIERPTLQAALRRGISGVRQSLRM